MRSYLATLVLLCLLPATVPAADEKPAPPAAATVPSAPDPNRATREKPYENGLGMRFVPVPITGGPTDGKRVLFSVWDTRVRDYEAYAKENPGVNMKPPEGVGDDPKRGPTHPAVWVSWNDAKAFCAWLTKKERAAGRLGAREEYRLPSDHEWSCAVGIGGREDPKAAPRSKTVKIADVYPWGNSWPPPAGAGNYSQNADSLNRASPVGSFAADAHGLYDMGGNVYQWCEDVYSPGFPDRVLRGSSWGVGDRVGLLSSYRGAGPTNAVNIVFGFRCVLAPGNAAASGPEPAGSAAPPPCQAR